jgi:hypothetical protein
VLEAFFGEVMLVAIRTAPELSVVSSWNRRADSRETTASGLRRAKKATSLWDSSGASAGPAAVGISHLGPSVGARMRDGDGRR